MDDGLTIPSPPDHSSPHDARRPIAAQPDHPARAPHDTGRPARRSTVKRGLAVLLGLAGAAGFAALVLSAGLSEVMQQLSMVGWTLLPLAMLHVVPIALDASAWRMLQPPPRPSLAAFMAARWVREGVNALLPGAQIGGEVAAVRMLARFGASAAKTGAVVSIDLATEFLSMVIVGTIGAIALYELSPADSKDQAMLVGWALLPPGAVAVGFLLVQRTTLLARLADRIKARRPRTAGRLLEAQSALTAAWSRPRQLALAVGLHSLGWMAGAAATWAMLNALGHPLRPEQAFALETTTEVLRSFGFAIPGLLGVQEGSLILVGGFLGLPPAGAVALSLFRRARDIGLGLPALALWYLVQHTRRPRRHGDAADASLDAMPQPAAGR